jgi:hypothetical protein
MATRKEKGPMRLVIALTLYALVLTALGGCGGGGGSSSAGRLQLFLTDVPVAADAVNVKLSMVCVHTHLGDWITIKTFKDTDPAINLLDYQAKNDFDDDPNTLASCLLLDTQLDAGHYTMVRLHIASMQVVIGGVPYPVDLSDVEPAGIAINTEFDVAKGVASALLMDFNCRESIIQTGEGAYKLKPVIAMIPKSTSGSISGTVVFKDGSLNAAPAPDGDIEVGIFVAGSSVMANSAQLNVNEARTLGAFTAGCLQPGTYDIKVEATGYSANAVRLAGVTLGVAEAKNVGEIAVSPP